MKKDTQIIAAQPQELMPVQDQATTLIAQAIDKNVPVETMEKLLAMRRELKQEQAKEAFDRAMAAFQAACPTITKTKVVKNDNGKELYRYAPIESIVNQVKDALKENGFSYSTSMDLLENGVKVCIRVTHAAGHSEETCMTVPLGAKTGIMSQSQQVAAATTFAKRYAFCNAFGILTGDEDNDGATLPSSPSPKPIVKASVVKEEPQPKRDEVLPITADQKGDFMVLLGKLGKTQLDLNTLVKTKYNLDSYQMLTMAQANAVIDFLKKRLEEKEQTSSEPVIDMDEADKAIQTAMLTEPK